MQNEEKHFDKMNKAKWHKDIMLSRLMEDKIKSMITQDHLKRSVQNITHTLSPKKKEKLIMENDAPLRYDTKQMKIDLGLIKVKEDEPA
jgi:hypothetical protein